MIEHVDIVITIEFGEWGGHYKRMPGASWRALIVDLATCQRYAGSDDSPWLAIGWPFHERRRRLAGGHAMARLESDVPWGRP